MTKMTTEEAMKPQNITLDISKLCTEELESLQKILYRYGYMKECKEINRRIAFNENW